MANPTNASSGLKGPHKGGRVAAVVSVAGTLAAGSMFLMGAGAAHAATSDVLAGSKPTWASAGADRGSAPAAAPLAVRVYLAGRDPQALAAYARSVADPKSAAYRHFLTPEQIQARFGASAEQVAAVKTWLSGAGLTVTGQTEDYIAVQGSTAAVAAALNTSFHEYATSDGTLRAPSRDVSVPADVRSAIIGIIGLSQDRTADKPNNSDGTDASDKKTVSVSPGGVPYLGTLPCSDYQGQKLATNLPSLNGQSVPWAVCGYTPNQVRGAYGVTSSGLTGKGVTVAVLDAYGLPSMKADADEYAARHGDKPFRAGQYSEIVTPGQWTDTAACGGPDGWAGEEALDVESVHGMAPDAKVLYIGANSCFDTAGGGVAANGGLLDSLQLVVDHHLADMVSNSWGELMHFLDPSGNPVDMDPSLINVYEQTFQKGAAEGIGFYFSAGDCSDDNPASSCGSGAGSSRAQAEYPTSSSWVTSVGGTSIAIGADQRMQFQTSWQSSASSLATGGSAWTPASYLYGGGGGTSDVFAQPWYQSWTVPASLSSTLLNGTPTSPKRVVPDVAAYGDPSTGFLQGYTQQLPDGSTGYAESRIGGTSLAAPTFVGIQADAQQAQRAPIGFANPEIYLRAAFGLFTDVTDHPRTNSPLAVVRGTAADPSLRLFGEGVDLHATKGYDNATGVGSPNGRYLESFE
ncbi:S8/S53 family peptidase [Catenulispora sp. NF23]|uniref:S8/S53 family peptidase n=1 Tax=Catenulispora pinistramenti TaxID=2705254 RepID=A0ABS5KMS0_9ACTN|nr:S53 family peptidase [Catenulispora pinistramenti]MBS2531393.1 S8/S53 family peptidase [Catenulispora pinistramenti]MBS2547325.1 S8/S53 family peptidase [Catenulispora pinistramenti]